jgi:hypothetical protein
MVIDSANARAKKAIMSALTPIARSILNETSTVAELQAALDEFSQLCSRIGGVEPDRSFNAWADDSLLASGVAINPQAAAHCVTDYQRSVVFMRGLYAALQAGLLRFPTRPLRVLYAGCGPYATLLLPLLSYFKAEELEVYLLDIHQRSLDSVQTLLTHFELEAYRIHTVQTDASIYQHPEPLHIIVAETMQKSLEQEPQVAVTCNLAPQLCTNGLFLPEQIEVELGLAKHEGALQTPGDYSSVARVFTLNADVAPELAPVAVKIPTITEDGVYSALLFTRIQVFGEHCLLPYEAEITLPRACPEMTPLRAGATFEIGYQLGSYPTFIFTSTSSVLSPDPISTEVK